MIRKDLYIWLSAIIVLLCPCRSNGHEQRYVDVEKTLSDTLQDSVLELPLPKVPSLLVAPEERAAYILEHFWDEMDFTDTILSRNGVFMEQNLVNFFSLFPHARQETLSSHIGRLLKRATADSIAFDLVNDIAELYLDNPNSPMRNEEYYILFLEESLRLPDLSEYARIRPAYQLEMARKNRIGTIAADFSYIRRDGSRRTLHKTRGRYTLLMFYDPACSLCSETLNELRDNPALGKLIVDKKLTVLAVYTEDNRELWDKTKDSMPDEWIVAIDDSRVVERELYSLPAMPAIYLLDRDKTVLLKDPILATLENILNEGIVDKAASRKTDKRK